MGLKLVILDGSKLVELKRGTRCRMDCERCKCPLRRKVCATEHPKRLPCDRYFNFVASVCGATEHLSYHITEGGAK